MNRFGIGLELVESFSTKELLAYDRAELLHRTHEELEKTVPNGEITCLMAQIVQELGAPEEDKNPVEKTTWFCKETFIVGFTCAMDVLLNHLSREQNKEGYQV